MKTSEKYKFKYECKKWKKGRVEKGEVNLIYFLKDVVQLTSLQPIGIQYKLEQHNIM